jgi:hypothetical protein
MESPGQFRSDGVDAHKDWCDQRPTESTDEGRLTLGSNYFQLVLDRSRFVQK